MPLGQKLLLWAGTTLVGSLCGLGWFVYRTLILLEDTRDALAFWILILEPLQTAMFWTIGSFILGFLLFLLSFLVPRVEPPPDS
jgi:hypothetical protein